MHADEATADLFSGIVVLHLKMLACGVANRVGGHGVGALVVTIKVNGGDGRGHKGSKHFAKPFGLAGGLRYCNVFCLVGGGGDVGMKLGVPGYGTALIKKMYPIVERRVSTSSAWEASKNP